MTLRCAICGRFMAPAKKSQNKKYCNPACKYVATRRMSMEWYRSLKTEKKERLEQQPIINERRCRECGKGAGANYFYCPDCHSKVSDKLSGPFEVYTPDYFQELWGYDDLMALGELS